MGKQIQVWFSTVSYSLTMELVLVLFHYPLQLCLMMNVLTKLDIRKLFSDHGIKAKAMNRLEKHFFKEHESCFGTKKHSAVMRIPCLPDGICWAIFCFCSSPHLFSIFARCFHVHPPPSPKPASLPGLWILEERTGFYEMPDSTIGPAWRNKSIWNWNVQPTETSSYVTTTITC